MNPSIVHSSGPVLLAGGGDIDRDTVLPLIGRADRTVAADGAAAALLALGHMPDAVIGDMDSLTEETRARIPAGRIHRIAEQDSTDFDKCLRNIEAPLIWGAGFLGARLDHELAAMNVLARRADRRCILVGRHDVVTVAPPRVELDLAPGTRVSLYPLAPVTGTSTGLRWPIDGIPFSPAGRSGTSNEATEARVGMTFDAPAMLLILPLSSLPALERSLLSTPPWPRDA